MSPSTMPIAGGGGGGGVTGIISCVSKPNYLEFANFLVRGGSSSRLGSSC